MPLDSGRLGLKLKLAGTSVGCALRHFKNAAILFAPDADSVTETGALGSAPITIKFVRVALIVQKRFLLTNIRYSAKGSWKNSWSPWQLYLLSPRWAVLIAPTTRCTQDRASSKSLSKADAIPQDNFSMRW